MNTRQSFNTFLASLCMLSCSALVFSAQSAEDVRPLLIGSTVPSAEVLNQSGQSIDLKSVLKGKSSVVIFYRGSWCPYCNTHLSELASIEDTLKAKGYQIIAISPDSPEALKGTTEKNSLGYQLISDVRYNAMEAFGVGYEHPRRGKLPVPSVFLVTPDLEVSFQYVNPNYKYRISSELLLAATDS